MRVESIAMTSWKGLLRLLILFLAQIGKGFVVKSDEQEIQSVKNFGSSNEQKLRYERKHSCLMYKVKMKSGKKLFYCFIFSSYVN